MTFNQHPDLFGFTPGCNGYPGVPGHRGVDTSATAAEDLAPRLGRLQQVAFEAIKAAGANGLTTHELAAMLDLPRDTIQPRTSELRKAGKIVDSRQRRFNANGKRAIVWTLPEYRRGTVHG